MKKIGTILLVIFLTGCSKDKSLNCVMGNDVYGNNVVETIDAFFKNGEISSINIKHEITLDEENSEYTEIYKKKIDEQFESFKDKQGIIVNLSEKDNVITLDVSIDVLNMNDEASKVIGFSISGSYDKSKESLEKAGYVCK